MQEKKEEPEKPIELVKKQESSNIDKPVEGYYVEKTTEESLKSASENNSDGELDTSIDTSKISVNPSIAIKRTADNIMDSMDMLVERTT